MHQIKNIKPINNLYIDGTVTGEKIYFDVYFPPSYFTNENKKFPVIYQLHGANQHYSSDVKATTTFFENVWKKGIWEEAIFVFPDGKGTSMWSNSFDGKINVETNIIQEIIPYIDKTFRTKNNVKSRFIQGFSMGGFGAMKLIGKYPNLFSKAMSFDGALHSWNTFSRMRYRINSYMFDSNKTYYDETANPRALLALNVKKFTDQKRLFICYGSMPIIEKLKNTFVKFLDENNIKYEVAKQLNAGHRLKTILKKLGTEAFRFYE